MQFQRPLISKTKTAIIVLSCFAWPFLGTGQPANKAFSIGARYHTDHSELDYLPFGSGDFSYLAAMEYAEKVALWQLGISFTPDVTGTRNVGSDDEASEIIEAQHVITPQINLIFKDQMFRGGTGILRSYIKNKGHKGEWTSIYWQMLLGLSFEIAGSTSLETSAHYVFRGWDWDKISAFAFSDLDYSLLLSFRF